VNTTEKTLTHNLLPFFNASHLSLDAKIVVAFSGGVDSLALLILLGQTVEKEQLHAVYVNHRLRSEKELTKEEELNKLNCHLLGIPFSLVRLEEGEVATLAKSGAQGIEDAARILRYAALGNKQKELDFDYIATAHTKDDQSETLMLRFFGGSGPLALQGIGEVTNNVIRPVLSFTKEELIEVVRSYNLKWSEDSTNQSNRYVRNQVRNHLIPAVKEIFPHYCSSLALLAKRFETLNVYVEQQVDQLFAQSVKMEDQTAFINGQYLKDAPTVLVEQILYRVWNLLGSSVKRLPYHRLAKLVEQLTDWHKEPFEIADTLVEFDNGKLKWALKERLLAESFLSCVYSGCTPLPQNRVLLRSFDQKEGTRIDESKLIGTLIARSSWPGDRIALVEGTKEVSSLIASWNIGRSKRWQIPVLEDQGGIVAVLGHFWGGKDRVAVRARCGALAPSGSTRYSVTDGKGQDCG